MIDTRRDLVYTGNWYLNNLSRVCGKRKTLMLYFPHRDRIRYVFPANERGNWQNFFEECALQAQWQVKQHVYDNIQQGRASMKEIEHLKNLQYWYVWALEMDIKTRAVDPKPKLVIRYPSLEEEEWTFGGVVAIGGTLSIVTLFRNGKQFVF